MIYNSLADALQARTWDIAIVSVPHASHDTITGNVSVDRHAEQKKELFRIRGSKGELEITPSAAIF